MNWNPISKLAIQAAADLGHTLGSFSSQGRKSVKTAACETCSGCCWIGWSPSIGYRAGGRLLKYRCGTPEAMGILRQPMPESTDCLHDFGAYNLASGDAGGGQGPNPPSGPDAKDLRPKRGLPGKGE